MCSEEGLCRFEARAVAAVAEHGARRAGSRRKLTARFGDIADVLREADFWRRQEGAGRVTAAHVKRAVREAEERGGLIESKLRDMIARGTLRIEVSGKRVGQINGLTVHEIGEHAFGLPARITATAAAGDSGIINIEREARLSGRTYDKGVLIIGGFLRDRFGHDKPISIAASLAFEQSYAEIEGDSASSAEIYALFSALASLPLEQGIAVTGSVDQKGRIQPVGGVEHKIEGFFRVCALKGLNGRQGVLIPAANVPDLMLDEEVVLAVRRKRFHVWPVGTVDEGIAILTGRPAGARRGDGTYPEGSIMALVDRRLGHFAAMVREYPRAKRIGG
jgi:predicted ATP-dependent protease